MVGLFMGMSALAGESNQIYTIADGMSPAIATDPKGNLHVALGARDKDLDLVDIMYVQSKDGAKTFSTPVDISDPGKSALADIAIEKSGAIDVAWSYTTSVQNSPDIFLVRSTNGGGTWATQVDISNSPGVSGQPDVAVGPDNKIHVVWKDTTSGAKQPDIFYAVSDDSGTTWSNPESVSVATGSSAEPAIAVSDDGVVHVAWESATANGHTGICYSRKTTGGWSKPLDVSKTGQQCSHPDIACGPKGALYLCWADCANGTEAADVFCSVGNKLGQFARPFNISDDPGISASPALVADSVGRVALVWSDTTAAGNTADILGKYSLDGGATFSNVIQFSNKETMSIRPDVSLAGSKLFVVWEESQGPKSVIKGTTLEIKPTVTYHAPKDKLRPLG